MELVLDPWSLWGRRLSSLTWPFRCENFWCYIRTFSPRCEFWSLHKPWSSRSYCHFKIEMYFFLEVEGLMWASSLWIGNIPFGNLVVELLKTWLFYLYLWQNLLKGKREVFSEKEISRGSLEYRYKTWCLPPYYRTPQISRLTKLS